MREVPVLGSRVRALRRRRGLSQVQLAERLAISASYLNLIEHNRRALSAPLLIKLAQIFELDLTTFAAENDTRLATEVMEAFGDSLFEGHELVAEEVRELSASAPGLARAVLALYQEYRNARESAQTLALRLEGRDDLTGVDRSRLPSEEVSDLLQRHVNYFPELEEGAEALRRDAPAGRRGPLPGARAPPAGRVLGVQVRVETVAAMRGAVRRYDRAGARALAVGGAAPGQPQLPGRLPDRPAARVGRARPHRERPVAHDRRVPRAGAA